jgi:[NiFe] hydrogenase diaphorase moiety large subunit
LLGASVLGREDFDFDIRIQMGAGAYVCGEETSLISSCEGLRGDPKDRPPFPVQKGFLGNPTPVNNVESFSCVARIFEESPEWFAEQGLGDHAGTKLYSVCGDCERPGVYELPFGTPLDAVLREAGGEGAGAVCVGGPSGTIVPPSEFHRALGYGDLATGGAVIVFSPERDPLQIAADYVDFFVHESCGTCTPCRVGNVLLQDRLGLVLSGRGTAADLDYLEQTGETMRTMSRCGLGQTSSNPVTSTLRYFRDRYEQRLAEAESAILPGFDVDAALDSARVLAGRDSSHFPAGSGGPR